MAKLCTIRPAANFRQWLMTLGRSLFLPSNESTLVKQLRIVLVKTSLNITYKQEETLNPVFTTVLKTGFNLVTPRNRTTKTP